MMKLLIKNGIVHPVTSNSFTGDILIEDGKIKGIEPGICCDEAQIIDANGLNVYPGIIEEHSHIGIHGEKTNQQSDNDVNEWSDPVTPECHALEGIKPFDHGFLDALNAGVTTFNVYPGSANPIGGIGVTLKNDPSLHFEEKILVRDSGLKMAMGENPKKTHSTISKKIMTRMGTAQVIRRAFQDAINYRNKKEKEKNPKMEILLRVLDGDLTAHVHAHKADDILTIIRIQEEFGFKMCLEHATESHLIADVLAGKNIKLAIGPMFTARYKIEVNNRSLKTPSILEKAGITDFCLITDHPVIPINNLPIEASMAVSNGLSKDLALRSITINPAKNLGIDDRVGSLEIGKDADIVICDREVLDPTHRVMFTVVNGKVAYDMEKEGLIL